MNGWGPDREVEKTKPKRDERHAQLRHDVEQMMKRLHAIDSALELIGGVDSPMHNDLVACARLFDRLVDELQPKKY